MPFFKTLLGLGLMAGSAFFYHRETNQADQAFSAERKAKFDKMFEEWAKEDQRLIDKLYSGLSEEETAKVKREIKANEEKLDSNYKNM